MYIIAKIDQHYRYNKYYGQWAIMEEVVESEDINYYDATYWVDITEMANWKAIEWEEFDTIEEAEKRIEELYNVKQNQNE